MKFKLGTFQNEILIPDGYKKLDNKTKKELNKKGNWLIKTTNNSINYISFNPYPDTDIDFENKNLMINNIRKSLNNKQGIICINNGETNTNHEFIYSIIKTVKSPLIGCEYSLKMYIKYNKKIYELIGEFIEKGSTGKRESIISKILLSKGTISIENNELIGWYKDPYDEKYNKGVLMNLSENEEYDKHFPDHPLTQVRELINTITNDSTLDNPSLDEQLDRAIKTYNNTYNQFSDIALNLYQQRVRSVDLILLVENLINSIANSPKSFETDFEEINRNKLKFTSAQEFANEELEKAKKDAVATGAGVALGAAVTFLAPSTAMWVATTFGTASTGTAISTLSGAAATNAALAWLGGGALSANGLGIAGGKALLALAGPVGFSLAGLSILTSIVLFANNKIKTNKKKQEEINSVKNNTHQLNMDLATLENLLSKTELLRIKLNDTFISSLALYNSNFIELNTNQQLQLGTLVNYTKSLSFLLCSTIEKEDN